MGRAALRFRNIAEGFKEDCMTLMAKFAETNSARFADFQTVWREMKFPLVFCGLYSFAELLEFTEEAISIAKQLFLPPNSDIARIGGLYVLYGLYTQQPTRGLVKVRMTLEEWIQTTEYIANVRDYGYADANYIFHILCHKSAFLFTAFHKEYGLERNYRKYQLTSTHMREMMQCKTLSTNQILKPAFEDLDVDEFEKCRLKYESCKRLLDSKQEDQSMEFTSVTPLEEIVTSLRKVVDTFIPDQAEASSSSRRGDEDLAVPTVEDDNIFEESNRDIGQDRQSLRVRAFKLKTLGQNHLRSCLQTNEPSEAPVGELPTSEKPEDANIVKTSRKGGVLNILRSVVRPRIKVKKGLKARKSASLTERSESEDDCDDPDPIEAGEEEPPQKRKKTSEGSRKSRETPIESHEPGEESPEPGKETPTSAEESLDPVKEKQETVRKSKRTSIKPERYVEQ